MATSITHAFFAYAGGRIALGGRIPGRVLLTAAALAAVPDADLLWRRAVSDHEGLWAHRGISHSLPVALVVSLLAALLMARLTARSETAPARPACRRAGWLGAWALLFAAMASHALLDTITYGARGVMLLAPFSPERFLLPWQPVAAAPLGLGQYVHWWGARALVSELLVIWIPMGLVWAAAALARNLRGKPAAAATKITAGK